MARVHNKRTVILVIPPSGVDQVNISAYCDTSGFPRSADTHDVTTYGKDSHVFSGGLKNGTFVMGGVYDDGDTNTPRTLFEDALGEEFQIWRLIEGIETGGPSQYFTAVLNAYDDPAPVADMHRWTASFQVSDDVVYTAQGS